MATGGAALQIYCLRLGAERGDQLVVHDLDDHLARRDRLDDFDADRLAFDGGGELTRDIERDVGLEQRAAHLAHRGVDVGFRQRATAGELVENAA